MVASRQSLIIATDSSVYNLSYRRKSKTAKLTQATAKGHNPPPPKKKTKKNKKKPFVGWPAVLNTPSILPQIAPVIINVSDSRIKLKAMSLGERDAFHLPLEELVEV